METQGRITLSLWSWRESNPRPNKEPKSFLHAYPSVDPSAATWSKATQLRPQPIDFRESL